ncbi:MAG: DUF4381 domain-containing protein, partial [Candidatus Thioglobus sp.]|nr:DUF4381 domain-containing protein [Candidatus Thioglobus sp.]
MPNSDLSQLKDIHTGDIGWQLAWGWWLVIFLAVILLTIFMLYWFKNQRYKLACLLPLNQPLTKL